jgi:adenylate cyclase
MARTAGDDIHGDGVNIAARLEGVAEPGGICVSDMVHAGVRNKLALDFDDDGEHSLKNIAEPVRVYRAVLRRREREAFPESDALFRRPAVAVLPFENLSRDPDDEYFADGLTEDLITALSLWRTFPVIARNSTFSYKGTSPDIRTVGEELGARYVIEGSVRRSGGRARITVQLINTETGHHVWAERFDRDLKDIFALQDELSLRITATVAPEMERTEQRRLSRFDAPDLDAWGYVQRGWLLVDQFTKESVAAARECFERAVAIDPSYCQAHVGVSRSHFVDYRWGFSDDVEHTRSAMMESARRAVDLDNQEARVHWVLGTAYRARQQIDLAISELAHSLELNQSLYFTRFVLGGCHFDAGRPAEAMQHIHNAIQLNPRDPRNFAPYILLSAVCLDVRDYAEAKKWAGNAIGLKTDLADAYLILASSLGHQGRFTEAAAAHGEYSRLREDRGAQPHIRVVVQIDQEHFQDGLRKAGVVD